MKTLAINTKYWFTRMLPLMAMWGLSTSAMAGSLDDITFSSLPGDQVEVTLHFSGEAPEPGSFTVDNPARIALDLPGTSLNIKDRNINVGVGSVRNISSVDAGGRTRVVVNLTKLITYDTQRQGNNIVLRLGGGGTASAAAKPSSGAGAKTSSGSTPVAGGGNSIQSVDFRRGEKGEGRIVVTISDPNTAIDLSRRGDQVIATLKNIKLPQELEQRLDVGDFATPVRTVDAMSHGSDVRLVIEATGQFDHLAYQADNRITIDVKKFEKAKEEQVKKKRKQEYTGERLSLNFQNIEVRAVLQLIADFTGVNMVTSDSVKGNVTLRLKNVPWDQALDIILKSKGLDKRQKGNVILVAPAVEIAAQEKLELEAQKQVKELAPIVSDSIQVNYAKAAEMVKLLQSKGNSLVSERGNVAVDERTNKILIQDTAQNIAQIAALIEELDVPVRQVLIESRIVLVTNSFSEEFGVQFGVGKASNAGSSGTTNVVTSGSGSAAHDIAINGGEPTFGQNLNVDLGVASPTGRIGLAIARLPFGTLLDLELSASQVEGKSEVVSSPRVITSDQHRARIIQGKEIPYASGTSSGATQIAFKEAVLALEVTPSITPDDRINMDLKVSKDRPDFLNQVAIGTGTAPAIDKQEVTTRVLVDNGETIVLGGIFEQTKEKNVGRVPFLGDIPIIGILFRKTLEIDDKSELMIFVTPKIVKENVRL